jgi:hypothetical protein
MDKSEVRLWLEAGGYELLQSTSGGYLVTKGGVHNVVYPVMLPTELNQGTSLERLVADVSEQIPELGDPPTD